MENKMFDKGFENRKKVLGAGHVERSWAAADDFNRPIQKLVTEYCWGEVWGDEAIPHKIRSMLNIAMLSVMNRGHELKLHVRGALRNGVTTDEIQAILMQVAIYGGVPASLEAFRIASEAIKAHEAEGAAAAGD
ncbi:MAG: carboxymuconolactone decarboxylase family protein [Bauldia sp.]|nr:carboxymuconolactone decarboxylase family protein [Bauldia sp.]